MDQIEKIYKFFQKSKGVTTDTRKRGDGLLYFALRGANFNGNTFAAQAIKDGCISAVVDDKDVWEEGMILVENALTALQDLATYHRLKMGARVLALTGSNGKTTTKELIMQVLSKKYRIIGTSGNYNNHIGVPLTLLTIKEDTEIAIIEMGANHQREIALLCSIAQPDYGMITNIGKAHLAGFGGIEGVKKGKGEMYDYLKASGGSIFVNESNPTLMGMLENIGNETITYATNDNAQAFCSGKLLPTDIFLNVELFNNKPDSNNRESAVIKTRLAGHHNFENLLAAACIGLYFDVDMSDIKNAIEDYVPSNNRSQVLKTTHNTIVLDHYNANPTSMAAAIKNFYSFTRGSKVLILGDMLELDEYSTMEHAKIIDEVRKLDVQAYFVGSVFSSLIETGENAFYNSEALRQHLANIPVKNATILLKGSRGIKLEVVLDNL